MLKHIRLVEAVGQFEQVAAAQIELNPLSLVYAENARGKTTLVSILRSLQSGDPLPIQERRRLGSATPPKVVLSFSDEANAIVFENGAWSASKPNLAIFDEQFVNDNIYSGLVVQSPQREGLHGLIVGARGVALLRGLQGEVDAIEEHNKRLRTLANAIPPRALNGLTVDQFCELPALDDVDTRIEEARKSLSAAQQQESILQMRPLEELPGIIIPPPAMDALLSEQISDVSREAERRVQEHLPRLGAEGEAWVAQGRKIQHDHADSLGDDCPFCAQSLQFSDLTEAYALHFSAAYDELKQKVERTIQRLEDVYGPAKLEQAKRQFSENESKFLFWSEFVEAEAPHFDLGNFIASAESARGLLLDQLRAKAGAPLEIHTLKAASRDALAALEHQCQLVESYNSRIREINEKAAAVREAITVASGSTLRTDLARLEASKLRQEPGISSKCEAYLAEKTAKKATEGRRSQKKRALDTHLQNVFPAYQESINQYLRRLNAGFRIDGVKSLNTRRGPSCIYSIVTDNHPNHPIAVNAEAVGEPSFRTILSTSDRATLALAVFLASIRQDDDREQRIAVIDDPINSLDEHRAYATVSEIRRLASDVTQVIILSHNRPLVCHLWETPGQIGRTAIEVARAGGGSTIRVWDVSTHGVTEHDKRHSKLREYGDNQTPNSREVAEALRPTLEAFLRVAYPEHIVPVHC